MCLRFFKTKRKTGFGNEAFISIKLLMHLLIDSCISRLGLLCGKNNVGLK